MDQIDVKFSRQEILALQQIIHRALLQSGMEIAEAAVVLNQKLTLALNASVAEQPRFGP